MGHLAGMQTLPPLPLPYSNEVNAVNKDSPKIDLFVISVPDPTTGDTTDWTFGVLGVIHSYCVELRPKSYSDGGFILPPDKIIPVGQETFAGLKALTRNM